MNLREFCGEVVSDGNAGNGEIFAAAVVSLDEYTEKMMFIHPTGGRSDASLETVAHHSSSASDISLCHRAGRRVVQGVVDLFWGNVASVNIIEEAVPSLSDDGERGPAERLLIGMVATVHPPLNGGMGDLSDAVSIGQQDWLFEEPRFVDPFGAGHLAVSIQGCPGGEDWTVMRAGGEDGRHSGSDGAFPDFECAGALDHRCVSDPDASDVGNGVIGARRSFEGNAEISRSGVE